MRPINSIKPHTTIVLPADFVPSNGDGWSAKEWYVTDVFRHMIKAVAIGDHGTITNQIRCFSKGDLVMMGLEC